MGTERIDKKTAFGKRVVLRNSPETTQLDNDGSGSKKRLLKEERNTYVRYWSQISSELPDNFDPHHVGFVRDYFRAQLRIAKGKKRKARRILDGLVKRTGYKEFEDNNRPILAAIDIAVRGSTNWEDDYRRKIEPAFRIDKS